MKKIVREPLAVRPIQTTAQGVIWLCESIAFSIRHFQGPTEVQPDSWKRLDSRMMWPKKICRAVRFTFRAYSVSPYLF